MLFLILTSLVFLTTPFFSKALQQYPSIEKYFKVVIYFSLVFLICTHILPECWEKAKEGGEIILGLTTLSGFFLFSVMEYLLHFRMRSSLRHLGERFGQSLGVILISLGLLLHTLFDGIGLFEGDLNHGHGHGHDQGHGPLHGPDLEYQYFHFSSLGLSIFLHSIPFAFLLWDNLRKLYSFKKCYFFMISICVSTMAGYVLSQTMGFQSGWRDNFIYLEGFIVGTLLHVLLHPLMDTLHSYQPGLRLRYRIAHFLLKK